MKFKLNPLYIKLTIALLFIEVAIALFLKNGFIRFTVGDFLASILVYSFFRSFLKLKPITIALLALGFSFSVEFLQLFNLLDTLDLRNNRFIATLLGSHFSISDLIAYALGVLTIFVIDLKFTTNENY